MNIDVTAEAMGAFQDRLGQVKASQWTAPTPCADWDVRALVNHVVGEYVWMPPLLAGKTIAEVGDQFDGDLLGDDPIRVSSDAGAAALSASRESGAQERTVHLSFGDFPGAEYIGQVTSDVIVHTWDLARAIGVDDQLSPSLLGFATSFLTPQIEAWRGAGALGPAVEVGDDASAQDRFIANTGRNPNWSV